MITFPGHTLVGDNSFDTENQRDCLYGESSHLESVRKNLY